MPAQPASAGGARINSCLGGAASDEPPPRTQRQGAPPSVCRVLLALVALDGPRLVRLLLLHNVALDRLRRVRPVEAQ